jgi:hypothetical protein
VTRRGHSVLDSALPQITMDVQWTQDVAAPPPSTAGSGRPGTVSGRPVLLVDDGSGRRASNQRRTGTRKTREHLIKGKRGSELQGSRAVTQEGSRVGASTSEVSLQGTQRSGPRGSEWDESEFDDERVALGLGARARLSSHGVLTTPIPKRVA